MSAPISLLDLRQDGDVREAFQQPEALVPVTVVIPTLDEAARITAAVHDLRWADEIIVVDGGSADSTVTLADAAGAKVLVVNGETIAGQRNAGIAAARNEWVLALDADERASPELRAELEQLLAGRGPRHAAYRMRFRNYYLGRELRYGSWGRDWHVRLFTRDRRYSLDRVHEKLDVPDDVGTLAGTIVHDSYRDLTHHVEKIVKYARWGADELYARGRRAGIWELGVRPAWRFARDYIVFAGWRDGGLGFVAAVMCAFASFLKYAFLLVRQQSPGA